MVMAVYNQAATLPAAIESIIKQSFFEFDFIIIDDHSTDETPLILNTYARKDKRIKVMVNRRHLGLTQSLNLGWRAAKTKYIARMDADDEALPQRFKKQRDYLRRHTEIGLLGAGAYLINAGGGPAGVKILPQSSQTIKRVILSHCPFIHPTWMLSRQVLLEMDGYNEAFPYAQDYELALRIVSRYPTANLPEPLMRYRVNSAEAISLKQLKQQEALAIKARWLALTQYGYPYREAWRLIKPALSFLVPQGIKRLIYEKIYWHGGNHRRGRAFHQKLGD